MNNRPYFDGAKQDIEEVFTQVRMQTGRSFTRQTHWGLVDFHPAN